LICYRKMDGANFISSGIAIAKAMSAAGARVETEVLAPRTLPGEPGWGLQHMAGGQFTTLAGGIPIRFEGDVVGGIGISGASIAVDASIAQRAAEAFSRPSERPGRRPQEETFR
jgi:uncharacterized protein GlcG (DUF336 family)